MTQIEDLKRLFDGKDVETVAALLALHTTDCRQCHARNYCTGIIKDCAKVWECWLNSEVQNGND